MQVMRRLVKTGLMCDLMIDSVDSDDHEDTTLMAIMRMIGLRKMKTHCQILMKMAVP